MCSGQDPAQPNKIKLNCFKKHVYYLGWNRSPPQVGCMRQVLGPAALGRPRGIGWRGRWEGRSGWGTHVNPWLIQVNVWLKPLQYCKVISLQLIKINGGKKQIYSLTVLEGKSSKSVLLAWNQGFNRATLLTFEGRVLPRLFQLPVAASIPRLWLFHSNLYPCLYGYVSG